MSSYDFICEIKNKNWSMPWLDFSIFRYERESLIIAASDDFSYYHNMEIIIQLPSYIQGSMEWGCDINEDFIKANIGINEKNDTENQIRTLTFYSNGEQKFTVVAESFSVNFDTVFYYKREHLLSGQRLAYWVE